MKLFLLIVARQNYTLIVFLTFKWPDFPSASCFVNRFLNDEDPILARQEKMNLNLKVVTLSRLALTARLGKNARRLGRLKSKPREGFFALPFSSPGLGIQPCFILGTGVNDLGEGKVKTSEINNKNKK